MTEDNVNMMRVILCRPGYEEAVKSFDKRTGKRLFSVQCI